MSEQSLEQRLELLLSIVGAHGNGREQEAEARRILQLARREGSAQVLACVDYAALKRFDSKAGGLRNAGDFDEWSRHVGAVEFPLPPVTRTVPRVEPDPHNGAREWKVEGRSLNTRANAHLHWVLAQAWLPGSMLGVTPERCELWASLLREPTRTEVVEE